MLYTHVGTCWPDTFCRLEYFPLCCHFFRDPLCPHKMARTRKFAKQSIFLPSYTYHTYIQENRRQTKYPLPKPNPTKPPPTKDSKASSHHRLTSQPHAHLLGERPTQSTVSIHLDPLIKGETEKPRNSLNPTRSKWRARESVESLNPSRSPHKRRAGEFRGDLEVQAHGGGSEELQSVDVQDSSFFCLVAGAWQLHVWYRLIYRFVFASVVDLRSCRTRRWKAGP